MRPNSNPYNNPKWLQGVVNVIFEFRYVVCLIVLIVILGLGLFLYFKNHWIAKDVAQICTGFFIVLTLFFTALNYEFTASKVERDNKAARELLTFNIAAEWHKAPIKDYQKATIEFEDKFIATKEVRDKEDFNLFLNNPVNIEYKEALKGTLNYFETVSIAIYRGLIDKDYIREFHRFIYQQYYGDYIFFIDFQRVAKKNDKIWINFTNLAEEWHPKIREEIREGILKSFIITKI